MFKVNAKVLKNVIHLVIDNNTIYNDLGASSESFRICWKELNTYLECLQDLGILTEDECDSISVLQYKDMKFSDIELKVTEIMVKTPNKAIDDFDLIEQF